MIPDQFWKKMKPVQRLHRCLYRMGFGWLIGWFILLLHHTGRKTGIAYSTPVQYEKINGNYCVGAGRGTRADWFRNVQANTSISVTVGSKHMRVQAEPVTDPERVADFLAYRLERHPLMVGSIMKLHHLPMKPDRKQLIDLASSTAMVILHPVEADQ